jgi:ATP-dependent Clp protease ATP-binding subunit ClpA
VVFERYSDQSRRALDLARDEALRLGHGHIGTEHLLLGILAEGHGQAAHALTSAGATLDGCRDKVVESAAAKVGGSGRSGDPGYTDRANRALERAGRLSLRRRTPAVETDHILVSVLDVEGTAGQVLRGLSVDPARVRDALTTDGNEAAVETPTVAAAPAPYMDRATDTAPVCPQCRTDLEATLTDRVVAGYRVVYCSACGCALGAEAARNRSDGQGWTG